jgi:hypothetical protein
MIPVMFVKKLCKTLTGSSGKYGRFLRPVNAKGRGLIFAKPLLVDRLKIPV